RGAELFVLFYMAGAVMMLKNQGLLWNQFFVQSRAATGMGFADQIPRWWAPSDPDVLAQRSFFHPAWYAAVGVSIFHLVMGRINSTILSYGLFRIASDLERLPFPMAPVGAQGIMALAEQQEEESQRGRRDTEDRGNWRWRVFSIGGILGLGFGAIYMAVPAITSALFDEPITFIPIPFVDWTTKTSSVLPAVATGMSLNLGQLVMGMVLPYFAMLGSFIGLVLMAIGNAFFLYPNGLLPSWQTSDETVATLYHNLFDFYFSFGMGIAIAIAIAGFWQVGVGIRKRKREQQRKERLALESGESITDDNDYTGPPPGRGDMPTSLTVGSYIFTSLSYVLLSGYLIDWHPRVMGVLVFFAFLYTPLISYVTARLEGLAGQVVQIPLVKEAAFILSGYRGGVDIWFLPLPMAQYGRRTVFYRQAELTGTKFWSVWKAELILVPIVMLATILFGQFIWSLAPIPGPQYPYAERMWELNAAQQSLVFTSTLGRYSPFEEAFNPRYLGAGALFGLVIFFVLYFLRLPIMLIYGILRGLNNTLPHVILPQFIGACIGRFYFQRRMGLKWRQYIPVVAAGFTCGMGLITVLAVGINFLKKAVIQSPF
ncbi:MAG: peptide transporter, partial [Phycisphaerae bacterium]|nr:peptide transporter [Phycisphaerae bacterium]